MQSWYSGDLRVLYIPHSELSYPPASKIQSPDPSRSSAMVPSARITQLWPKAITQQITNLAKNQNVPQNHKIQKACQLTENKSINVQLKRRDCSKLFKASKKFIGTVGDCKPSFRAESDAKLRTKVRTPGNCLIKTLRESRYARSRSREPECSASLSWPPPNQFLRSPDQGPVEDNDTPSVAVCAVQIIKVFFDQRTSNQVINTICLHCQWTKVVRSRKNEDLAS